MEILCKKLMVPHGSELDCAELHYEEKYRFEKEISIL